MNWVDTPLLVYRALDGHPARSLVQEELRAGEWGSSVLVLFEVFQVLTREYAVSRSAAGAEVALLARSPISWAGLQAQATAEVAAVAEREGLASTDAVLLHLAERDRGVLVTQDARLLRAAQARGVAARNPIRKELAAEIAAWESAHLPEKGLARLLGAVLKWLRGQDPVLAERFQEATGNLSRLPT